jgi:DNA-binding beta-propeller fold protein YncE
MKPLFLALWLGAALSPAWALSPMAGPHDLVAGEGIAGFRDGPFTSALFRHPRGLALDGDRLYVADTDNDAIRVVDLSNKDRVSTLCGSGKPGAQDGPASAASFNRPGCLAFLPGRGLAVADNGNHCIRLVDPAEGRVSTLLGKDPAGGGDLWAMAVSPGGDTLYFTQPDAGTLKGLDLRTLKVTVLLSRDKDLPHPGALCFSPKGLYVADRDNGGTFRVVAGADAGTWRVDKAASGPKVVALAWSDGRLYALQADDETPVARLLPRVQAVRSLTVWGEPLPDPADFFARQGPPVGPFPLLADPSSGRRFFVANPRDNVITSFRDLDYGKLGEGESVNAGGLMDFEYPRSKPPGTFRILLVGDSHLYHSDYPGGREDPKRMELLSKRLELELNTLSALGDGPLHYEVLTRAEPSFNALNVWPYYEVPKLVPEYDIDLVVLMLMTNLNVDDYYLNPLTGEGIPAEKIEPDYALKPWKERVPPGPPADLLSIGQAHGWVKEVDNQLVFDYGQMAGDGGAVKDLEDMFCRPLRLLAGKVAAMRTSQGVPVRLELALVPYPGFGRRDPFADRWEEVAKDTGIPFLDLIPQVTALRLTYYPFSEIQENDHFDPDGHLLMSNLLLYGLVGQGVLPSPKGGGGPDPAP